jgi:hypothetical protein
MLFPVFRFVSVVFALGMLACGHAQSAKPDLPSSVSLGWSLGALVEAPSPAALPPGSRCWRADYTGLGMAQVWVCTYPDATDAFDAVQRAPAEAQTVKFQEGKNLILVHWDNVPKANLEALVRAIQKTLKTD